MTKNICYFIGIGGIGMSSLARIALDKGYTVLGSDASSSATTEALIEKGAKVFIGHKKEQVSSSGQVIYSTGIKQDNPEMIEAKKKGLRTLHRSEFLAELMEGSFPLLVTGTHGKTTTSSLLAQVMRSSKEKASYSVGGIIQRLQSNGSFQSGAKWFIAEADESDGSFLAYNPYGAIITNIGLDHLSYWGSEEKLLQGFYDFYKKVQNKESLFWCVDDTRLKELNLEGTSYGFSKEADLKVEKVSYLGWKSSFDFSWKGKLYVNVEIPMIGKHSVLNALAVFGMCLQANVEEETIRKGLLQFLGVKRRVEKKGEVNQIAVYDDYGHHPTEIRATLKAVKEASSGRRVVVAFQPQRFTRTRDSFADFAPALEVADLIILTDIYSAGEEPIEGIDSKALYATFLQRGCDRAYYLSKEDLLPEMTSLVKSGDVVVFMGAGDITKAGPQLLQRLEQR